jgi:hypothetical protein
LFCWYRCRKEDIKKQQKGVVEASVVLYIIRYICGIDDFRMNSFKCTFIWRLSFIIGLIISISADPQHTFDFWWKCVPQVKSSSSDQAADGSSNHEMSLCISIISSVPNSTRFQKSLTILEKDLQYPLLLLSKSVDFLSQDKYLAILNAYLSFQQQLYSEAQYCGIPLPSNYQKFQSEIYSFGLASMQNLASTEEMLSDSDSYRFLRYSKLNIQSFLFRQYKCSIIISGKPCKNWENCELSLENPSMMKMITSLLNEVKQLSVISQVNIHYGYGMSADMVPTFRNMCDRFIEWFGKISYVSCHAIVLSETHAEEAFIQDYRYAIAKDIYKKDPSMDYYFLLDPLADVGNQTSWLFSMLIPTLFSTGIFPGFGITYSSSNQEKHIFSNNFRFPTLFLLQKSHFQFVERFDQNSTTYYDYSLKQNNDFLSMYFPSEMNHVLLYSSYAILENSLIQHEVCYQKDDFYSFSSGMLEDYYDLLMINRRKIVEVVLKQFPIASKKVFYQRKIALLPPDILFGIFCELSNGCINSNDSVSFSVNGLASTSLDRSLIQHFSLAELGLSRVDRILVKPLQPMASTFIPSFIRRFPSFDSIYSFDNNATVAIITAVYGNYESSCKKYPKQSSISANFICFSDNPKIESNGWLVDTIPYHLFELINEFTDKILLERNSFHHNLHPFNVGKYYKVQFHKIPLLSSSSSSFSSSSPTISSSQASSSFQYDYMIWVDGSILITDQLLVEKMLLLMKKDSNKPPPLFFNQRSIISFEHTLPSDLTLEVNEALKLNRYTQTFYNDFHQPLQPLKDQLEAYLSPLSEATGEGGYQLNYWKKMMNSVFLDELDVKKREYYGLWVTCFLVFDMKNDIAVRQSISRKDDFLAELLTTPSSLSETAISMKRFLDFWFSQIMKYSTEDQISFVYSLFKFKIFPYSLPVVEKGIDLMFNETSSSLEKDMKIYGNYEFNNLFIKLEHGK